MRAGILTSCAVLALLWQSQPGLGQATTAQATSGQAAGPSGAAAPGKAVGRVGSLSPDEERRAARGRERAAKAAQAAARSDGRQADAPQATPPQATPQQAAAPQPATPREAPAPRDAAATHRSVAVADGKDRPAPRRTASAASRGLRSARVDPSDGGRMRRSRRRPDREPRFADDPGRAPRVGDVVAPDVPLVPLPPGLRPGFATRVVAETDGPRGPFFVRQAPPAYPPYPGYRY